MLSEETSNPKGHKLNKPFRTPNGPKKFAVYVKNDKGNVVKVNFGDSTGLSIKRDQPERRKAYRARHGCDDPGPKWKANYWSCRMWTANKTVADVLNDGVDEVTLDDVLLEMGHEERTVAEKSGKILARDFKEWAKDKYDNQKPTFRQYLLDISKSPKWRSDWFDKFLGAVEKSFDKHIKAKTKLDETIQMNKPPSDQSDFTVKVGDRTYHCTFDGKFYRAGVRRAKTKQGLIDMLNKSK